MVNRSWYKVLRPNREVLLIAPIWSIQEMFRVLEADVMVAEQSGERLKEHALYVEYWGEEWQALEEEMK